MRLISLSHLLAGMLIWMAAAATFAEPAETASRADDQTSAVHSAIWLSAEGDWIRENLPVERLVEEMRALPFEEVLVQVVENGSAYYNSKTLSKALGLQPNFDPLDRLLRDLHNGPKRKAVIAWIDPFHVGNVNSPLPVSLLSASPERINWLSRNYKDATQTSAGDRFLEPGLPEVRALMAEVVKELAKYAVDGIYIDPMGDPGADWGYHPAMLQRFQTETKRTDRPQPTDPAWVAFRAQVINETLTELVKAAREARPGIMVSVGAGGIGKAPATAEAFKQSDVFNKLHQDWPQWLMQGAVDRIYVKNFHNEATEGDQFTGWVNFALAADKNAKGVAYIGVAGYMNDSIAALRQMQRVALSGAHGLALSNFQNPESDPGVRDLFFTAIAETALSTEYIERMHQLADNPRNPDKDDKEASGSVQASGLELPPPPTIEEGQSTRLIPIIKGDKDIEAARQLAGFAPMTQSEGTTTAAEAAPTTQTLTKLQPVLTPKPNQPRTRREMLIEMLKNKDFTENRENEALHPAPKSEDYLKTKYQGLFDSQN